MFVGFVQLGQTIRLPTLVTASGEVPHAPDAPPSVRVYGPLGLMPNGTLTATAKDASAAPALYEATLPVLGSDGYDVGETYLALFTADVLGVAWGEVCTFTVV